MHGISYHLRLLEPVLINSLEGDNNTAQSYSFVPGSAIRGAVIGAYLAQRGKKELDDAAEPEVWRLFFSGTTCYLHAYPFAENQGERALPVPLSWRRRKDDQIPDPEKDEPPIPVFDLSVTPDDGSIQLQALGVDVFCVPIGDKAYQVEAERHLNVHTQRDALPGRATETHGAVYRYESLAAGTVLAGIILTASAEDAKLLKDLIEDRRASVGKARTAGYGSVRFEEVNLLDDDWSETRNIKLSAFSDSNYELEEDEDGDAGESDFETTDDAASPAGESGIEFTLTLLSDAIVRDDLGQYTLDPLPALRRHLRAEDGTEPEIESVYIFRRESLLGGFNRKWNLPLPQVAALAAGSVFKLKLSSSEDFDRLLELEKTGIGERRAEGFGRVAINWHMLGTFDYSKSRRKETDIPAAESLNPKEQEQVEKILQRLLRRDLDAKLLEAVNRIHIKVEKNGIIPNSQLSRWRSIARSALAEKDLARLADFHAAEEEKKSPAWERMRRARVYSGAEREQAPRLTDWIGDLVIGKRNLESELRELPKRKLGEVAIEVTEELEKEYRIRLLDAVLARKAKQQAQSKKEKPL